MSDAIRNFNTHDVIDEAIEFKVRADCDELIELCKQSHRVCLFVVQSYEEGKVKIKLIPSRGQAIFYDATVEQKSDDTVAE